MAIAFVQLRLTWELTGFAGFIRPPQFVANYLFPPAHWAQFALPEVFLRTPTYQAIPTGADLRRPVVKPVLM